MRSYCQRHLPPLLLLLCLACSSSPAGEFTDHRVQIKIDRRATIVTPESPLNLKRAMLGMQRHPDGSILLCLQTLPVLLRSSDQGRTWTTTTPGPPVSTGCPTGSGWRSFGWTGSYRSTRAPAVAA